MKKILAAGLLLVTCVLLASCAAPPGIKTDLDPQIDITRYRTYAFLEGGPKTEGAITDKLANDRLRHMIAVRMGASGYMPAPRGEPADLGVYFSGKVVPKQSVLMVGRPGPYDYSWGRTELGGYSTADYREGTLNIDVVELASNRLAWRSTIAEAFAAGYTEDNWKKLDRALDQAFEKLPARR